MKEIDVFYLGKLYDPAQLILRCWRFFITLGCSHTLVAQYFVHNTAICIATVIALPAHHMTFRLPITIGRSTNYSN